MLQSQRHKNYDPTNVIGPFAMPYHLNGWIHVQKLELEMRTELKIGASILPQTTNDFLYCMH